MPFSHHSHSGQFCRHAEGTLEEVVCEAIQQGFQVYGLSEHVPRYRETDLYPEEADVSLQFLTLQFESFLVEAHRLKETYASQITLLVGLETEYITPEDLDQLESLLKKHGDRVEYIVGSLHHVNETPIDFDKPTYDRAVAASLECVSATASQLESFLCSYFDAQFKLFTRFQPEIIGHIDLCRLYTPNLQLSDFETAWKKLERNVAYAIAYGALFELNAAAFRKGWKTAYPGRDVVELIQEHGGKFTVSDDSHGPKKVGSNYDKLVTYARSVGIKNMWYLCQSRDGKIRSSFGRNVYAADAGEKWWENPFWHAQIQ